MLQNKLRGLEMENESSDEDEEGAFGDDLGVDGEGVELSIPQPVFRRLMKMKELHEERVLLLEQYHRERAELEAKYRAMYQPLFGKRGDLIAGRVDVPPGEYADPAAPPEPESGSDIVGVPQFWLRCMLNHDNLAELINSQDVNALEYLIDIQCEDKIDLTGFTLNFHFAPNPFFKNSVLSKTYDMASIVDNAEPVLENVTGTAIQWKPKMDLCFHEVMAKSHSRPGESSTRKVRRASFFHFFGTPRMQQEGDLNMTEDDLYTLTYEMDYEFALIFRNHMIPDAILWFTGEAVEDEDEDYDDDDDGEDDDDDVESEEEGVGDPVVG
mmetsp:Transcript_27258/g.35753  ORF Transcript_27258/g.35753 Transcript_27258/m.35753 type:complete len:326 (-) Transcript_27258:341-1318(-)